MSHSLQVDRTTSEIRGRSTHEDDKDQDGHSEDGEDRAYSLGTNSFKLRDLVQRYRMSDLAVVPNPSADTVSLDDRIVEVVSLSISCGYPNVIVVSDVQVGEVGIGESSVVIVVAAPHRGEAFEACRYAIEELKARAPIWKAERFADGSVWMGAPARSGPQDEAE